MAELIILVVGLNIFSQLYLIRKDKEKVAKRDYIKFFVESLYITCSMLMMKYLYVNVSQLM